jgi:sugar/nucleoside kinase (ribokinase family)
MLKEKKMSQARYDVVGVGNAIVDIIAEVGDDFLNSHAIEKGAMTLIDQKRAEALTAALPSGQQVSGGSAANTIVGVASFGGKAAYLGKVSDDALGASFREDIRAAGVDFNTKAHAGPETTARCLIAVTPDHERSMSTFLGASTLFEQNDVDAELIKAAQWTYLEGYLFDRDEAKRAFVHAAEIAKAAGRKVAITLSDLFCVDRHRESFRSLVRAQADLVFANEAELLSLYETDDFDAAITALRADSAFAFVTRSEKGAVVITDNGAETVAAHGVPGGVKDTTGAGDLFAAGALFGLAHGKSASEAGQLGCLAAAEVISHIGARPQTSLKTLAVSEGVLA